MASRLFKMQPKKTDDDESQPQVDEGVSSAAKLIKPSKYSNYCTYLFTPKNKPRFCCILCK